MATKSVTIGYYSSCVGNIAKILAPGRTLWGRSTEWCQSKSTTTDLRCHSNKIWDTIGYNMVCIGDMSESLRLTGGIRVEILNDASQIP